MRKIVGDRARSGQRPQDAFFLSLLHHTRIGNVQSVDFVHSAYTMTTFLPHVLKIKQYQEFWCYLLRNVQIPLTFDVLQYNCVCPFELGQLSEICFKSQVILIQNV